MEHLALSRCSGFITGRIFSHLVPFLTEWVLLVTLCWFGEEKEDQSAEKEHQHYEARA
jgi:hypothetical protein